MAAQEMSGWWSLTSTTKADSAQPAVLGGRSAVHKVLADTTSATPDRSTGVIMALPKATIVTGGLEGHGPRVEVGGGGLGALGLVGVQRAAARQRTVALSSASGPLAAGLAADWPS